MDLQKEQLAANEQITYNWHYLGLILPYFDLASTTVTGIPMKEEQNASSSANYDAGIFHGRKALGVPRDGTGPAGPATLKWCTPRSCGSSEMQACPAQCRVTLMDFTSRPSSCLINFLLNGRSVLLAFAVCAWWQHFHPFRRHITGNGRLRHPFFPLFIHVKTVGVDFIFHHSQC